MDVINNKSAKTTVIVDLTADLSVKEILEANIGGSATAADMMCLVNDMTLHDFEMEDCKTLLLDKVVALMKQGGFWHEQYGRSMNYAFYFKPDINGTEIDILKKLIDNLIDPSKDWNFQLFALVNMEDKKLDSLLEKLTQIDYVNTTTYIIGKSMFCDNIQQLKASIRYLYTLARSSIHTVLPNCGITSGASYNKYFYSLEMRDYSTNVHRDIKADYDVLVSLIDSANNTTPDCGEFLFLEESCYKRLVDEFWEEHTFKSECYPIPKELCSFFSKLSKYDDLMESFIRGVRKDLIERVRDGWINKISEYFSTKLPHEEIKMWIDNLIQRERYCLFNDKATLADLDAYCKGLERGRKTTTFLEEHIVLSGIVRGAKLCDSLDEKLRYCSANARKKLDGWMRSVFKKYFDEAVLDWYDTIDRKALDNILISERNLLNIQIQDSRRYESLEAFALGVDNEINQNRVVTLKHRQVVDTIGARYYCDDISKYQSICTVSVRQFFDVQPSFIDLRLPKGQCIYIQIAAVDKTYNKDVE